MLKPVEFQNPRIIVDTVEHVIVEYTVVDVRTGKIVGLERQKYKFDSIIWEHKCTEECEEHGF